MIAAIIILGVLLAAAIFAIVYLEQRHEAERERARTAARSERAAARSAQAIERQRLLDRLQAPQAAYLAAMDATVAFEVPEPTPDPYDEPVAPSSDLELADLLEEKTDG